MLAALPAEVFPLTVAAAGPMAGYGSDEQYDVALGLLVGGVHAATR